MGQNRDAANDVYTSLKFSRVVATAPESMPTLATDGENCIGFNVLALSTKMLGTSHSYELYFWDGHYWKLIEGSSELTVDEFDPTKDFFQHYNISAVERFYVRLMTSVGGATRVTTNIGV
jgi:hypothetical protein